MSRRTRSTGASGFTLVELMVVMIVMIILFAISLPALLRVQYSKGVETSAHKLQAVMLHARALAARYQNNYSVVFSNWTTSVGLADPSWTINCEKGDGPHVQVNDGYDTSLSSSYMVIGHELDGSFPGSSAVAGGWRFNRKPDHGGPISYAKDELVWTSSGLLYKCTNNPGPGAPGYSVEPDWGAATVDESDCPQGGCGGPGSCKGGHGTATWEKVDSSSTTGYRVGKVYYLDPGVSFLAYSYMAGAAAKTWDSGNWSTGVSYPNAFRVTFTPTGEAKFKLPSAHSAEDDTWQTIAVCKEGDKSVNLRVVVNKYSGDVVVKGRD